MATDARGRVLDANGSALPDLYAIGESAGNYYNSYPGATSVLRTLDGGRLLLGPTIAFARRDNRANAARGIRTSRG